MRFTLAPLLAIATLIGVLMASTPSHADPSAPLKFTRIYTDDQGVTHFREETFAFKTLDLPNSHGALATYAFKGNGGTSLLRLKLGATEDWHKAPRRQFLIIVQGTAEVTVSDGSKRQFSPGSVLLMDDTTGKGHITQNVSDVDHIAAVIPVSDSE